MPLEAFDVPQKAGRPQTYHDALMDLLPQRADIAAHGSTLAPASEPSSVATYSATPKTALSRATPQLEDGGSANHDGRAGYGQYLASWPKSRETHMPLRQDVNSESRSGGARKTPSVLPRPVAYLSPSRSKRPDDASLSALEMDELANSEEDIKSDSLPFIRPGFGRRREQNATPPRPRPRPSQTPQAPSADHTQLEHPSGLGTWQHSDPPKTNGNENKYSVKSIPQPVVVIPLVDRPTLDASRVPLAVSASSLAHYTPKKYKVAKSSENAHPKSTTGGFHTPDKFISPLAAAGRRSMPRSGIRPKRDRAKSTSYREVAVHDEDTFDTNYSPYPPESLVLSRSRKIERFPSRARPRQSLSYRKVVRAPIQSAEAIQRSIFVTSEAFFAPFVCEWAGCRAELQNMETLRRHVAIVHSRALSTVQTCRWRGCAAGVAVMHNGDDDVTNAVTDAERKTFLEHVEHQHLLPLAWLQGDGFANTGHIAAPKLPPATVLATKSRVRSRAKSKATVKDKRRTINTTAVADSESPANTAVEVSLDAAPSESLPRYLLDERGQQVTPLLRDTVLESSSILWTQEERERRLKNLYRQQQQILNQRPSWGPERIA